MIRLLVPGAFPPSRAARALLAALAAALLLDGALLWRAVALDPLPRAARGYTAPASAPPLDTTLRAASADEVEFDDPFTVAREEPVVRQAAADADSPATAGPATVLLLGTVLLPGAGGFAVCQLGIEPPRTVHVGERVGALTLVAVEQSRAHFRRADGARQTIEIFKPGG